MGDLLCHQDDVYVGFGATGVVNPPDGKDLDWLRSHCWLCGRSDVEIRQAIAEGRK